MTITHNNTAGRLWGILLLGIAALLQMQPAQAARDIRGIVGPDFNLYAYPFYMSLPEGTSLYMWGFGDLTAGAGATHAAGQGYYLPQYPAPTLIVDEGQEVMITLTNYGVPDGVGIVVSGHEVTADGGSPGLVTNVASATGPTAYMPVTYTFTAGSPGTYLYHSMNGPNPGLHKEMGLVGALIVRPADASRSAYGANSETGFEQEYLYLLTDLDPAIHFEMEGGHYGHFTYPERYPSIWFVNGRVFPDLFQEDYHGLFPHQPYAGFASAHPGDDVLIRVVNAGQDSHPFHFHGENTRFIARDGRMISSDGLVADMGRSDNTVNSVPGQTLDLLWTWTGKDLGWDIYGPINAGCTDVIPDMADDATGIMCNDNICTDNIDNRTGVAIPDGFDDDTYQYCVDHGKPLPVSLPGVGDLTFGGWWSGSPFLGDTGDLPPGEGGLNPYGGYFLVWHSHAEKEITTFNIFPGGTLSAVAVLPPFVPID